MYLRICSFSLCLFIGSWFQLQAQYYLKVRDDSIAFSKDSVILILDNHQGSINWQSSQNSVNWKSADVSGDTFRIRIDSNAAYRAQVNEGTCEPLFSDTLQIKEKAIHTNVNYFTADSSGGVFYLPDGIKIKIPPKAIDSTLMIYAELIDSATCYGVLPAETDAKRMFLGSVNITPNDVVLQKPIKIKIPVNNYGSDNLFITTGYDPLLYVPLQYHGILLVSFRENYAEYVTNRLVPIRIEAIPLTGQNSKKKSTSDNTETNNCREGVIIVKTMETDFESYFKPKGSAGDEFTDCETPSSSGEITFVDCGNITESYSVREISSSCEPEMEVIIEKDLIKTGKPIQAKVILKIGDVPLTNQSVNIIHSNSIDITTSDSFTDKNGILPFVVTANKPDNNAYFECQSQVQYHRQVIIVRSETATHRWSSYPESKYRSQKKDLICYDECTRPENLDCKNLSSADCERVKLLLTDEVEILPQKLALRKGTSFTYPVKAKNYIGDYTAEIPTIIWSSSNPIIANIINGQVTAYHSGTTKIYADWCNSREQNEILVGDKCDSGTYIIDNSAIKLFKGDKYRVHADYESLYPGNDFVPDIHWKTFNTKVVTVDSGGYLTAKNFGQDSVRVSWCDTSVTIPVTVRPKKETWVGCLTTGHRSYTLDYNCAIGFNFTVYWDSLKPPDTPDASGGIKGSAEVVQEIQRKHDSIRILSYAVPEFNLEIEGTAWNNTGDVLLKFPGYYGYWKTRKCVVITLGGCPGWIPLEDEEYYDLIPDNNQTILIKGQTEIDTDIGYRFGFNCAGGNCVPYAYDVLENTHIYMERVWCNYE